MFLIVEPPPLLILTPLEHKYLPQDPVFKYHVSQQLAVLFIVSYILIKLLITEIHYLRHSVRTSRLSKNDSLVMGQTINK
jgi:hypothetical protein